MQAKQGILALVVLASAGCGGGDDDERASACADTSKVIAFPTPAWQEGQLLSPPEGDFGVQLVRDVRPTWAEQLALVDGWPVRPTLVVPLDAAASTVDASHIALFGSEPGGAPTAHDVVFRGYLSPEGTSLVIQPRDPFPPDVTDVVVAVGNGAIGGAHALPACGADGEPLAAYAAAAKSLPEDADVALALPFRIATTSSELSRLFERLSAQPVLNVDEVEARTLASFGDAAPPADVAPLLGPTAASGILSLPAYADTSGVFQRGADGAPETTGVTKPGFVVALPATGSAPYPFVLFQHGGGQNKTDFLQLAGPLAQAGIAFVAIDLPLHGDRAGGAGGTDLDFVNFQDLARTRDNFRQAVADHMAVFTGIAALNAALEPVLGQKDVLDASRGFYMGLSLGGISGSITFATTEKVKAAGLFVAAAGYPEIVSKGLFSALIANIVSSPTPEKETFLGLAEVVLDGADPLAYARRVEDRTLRPRPALFMQAIADPVIPEPSSDQWARAFGADLALPKQHDVEGMDELALPQSDNFAFGEAGEKATRILVQNPMNEIPAGQRHGALIVQAYSQQIIAHCFSTWLDKGSCELIDTGFAQH